MSRPRIAIFAALLFIAVAAIPQQPVAPPSPPAADSRSLEVTMKFIKSKIEGIGDLEATVTDDNDPQAGARQSNTGYYTVVANSTACTVQLTQHHSGGTPDFYKFIALRDISRIDPLTHGDPQYPNLHFSPVFPALNIHFSASGKSVYIEFGDEDVADRVAKALTHAVEFCGGGNKDPF